MKLERSLWAAFLIATLLPGLEAGVNAAELLAIVSCLCAGSLLALTYSSGVGFPSAIWLLVSYLVLSFVGLTHDPLNYFLSSFAGGLAFSVALAVGGSAPDRLLVTIVKWMFLLLLGGAVLDIAFDVVGWSPMANRASDGWEAGARGFATARSANGMYLSPFMAYMVVAAPSVKWRVFGAAALMLVFYHVVVFGQGRGATSLAVLGSFAVFARELRSLPVALLVIVPFSALLGGGYFDEATAPFLNRVASEDLSEVDRIHHAQVGEMLVRSMNGEEVLFGMDHRKVTIANGGVGMHNAFFDTLVRYGLFASAPWLVFNIVSFIVCGVRLVGREVKREQTLAAVVALQMLAVSLSSPIFINWRTCVIPGLCTGLVLRTFQSEVQIWRHS